VRGGGDASGGIGGGGELGDVSEEGGGDGDFVGVVELDEGEAGIARDVELGLDKGIEGGDGGFLQGLHGAGAVEYVGDFGEVRIHNPVNWHRGWDNCGLRCVSF
jgi:hypothetical protein